MKFGDSYELHRKYQAGCFWNCLNYVLKVIQRIIKFKFIILLNKSDQNKFLYCLVLLPHLCFRRSPFVRLYFEGQRIQFPYRFDNYESFLRKYCAENQTRPWRLSKEGSFFTDIIIIQILLIFHLRLSNQL